MATYPPPQHILRDLLLTSYWVSDTQIRFVAPLADAIRDASGAAATGPICAMVDLVLAHRSMHEAEGDWIGTLDLAMHRAAPLRQGPVVITADVVRRGGRLITTRCEISDGEGDENPSTLCGTATGTFRRMARELSRDDETTFDRTLGVRSRWSRDDSGFETSVAEKVGLSLIGPGVIELEKSPYVTNSFGTVNGGTTAILVAATAESVVDGGFVASDVAVRYVGRAGEGSVRASATVLRVGEEHAVVDVTVVTLGDASIPIAMATVSLTRSCE